MITPTPLLDALRDQTDSVLVAFSCGKDSLAALHAVITDPHFKKVVPFFFQGRVRFSFLESVIAAAEARYKVEVLRVPHWCVPGQMRQGYYQRNPGSTGDQRWPSVKINDAYNAIRYKTGIEWIVTGEKAYDSMERRGMMAGLPGIHLQRRIAWPLQHWNDEGVYQYLKANRIPIPGYYARLGRTLSLGRIDCIAKIAEQYPHDFEEMCRHYPKMRAVPIAYRMRQKQEQRERKLREAQKRIAREEKQRAKQAAKKRPDSV